MEEQNSKQKMKRWKKILIIVIAVIMTPIVAFFAFVIADMNKASKPDSAATTEAPAPTTINFEKSDVKKPAKESVSITDISSDFDGSETQKLLSQKQGYTFADYYDIDSVLNTMNSTHISKKTNTDVLDENGKVDADKLYKTVTKNNELAKNAKGKNMLNSFYSDATTNEIREICDLITQVINDTTDDRDITETASALSRLKIFRHNTTSDLAGVSQNLVFYFNPNMISINKTILSISGRNNKDYDEKVLTFVHEIEHIKQWASSDEDNDNGMEAGFCRKYNGAAVNSLWDQWVLEAAAEIKMTEYLNTDAMVYAKKINYANSYSLTKSFDDSFEYDALLNATFENDLDGAFKKLGAKTDSEKENLLNLLYTIQITQYDCDDFWDYYQKKTNKKLTDDERASLRLDVRADAIYDLTDMYYADLIKGIQNKNIRDAETVFFMMKIWELDCCGHMVYTKLDAYSHATDYLLWLNDINDSVLKELAKSTGKSFDEISKEYQNYHPLVKNGSDTERNYRFYNMNSDKEKLINDCFDGYSVTYYCEVYKMVDYINAN